MKSRERILAEIEVTEGLICQLRDDIRNKEKQVGYLQLRIWRRKKIMLRKRVNELKEDLENINQLGIFE